MSEISPRGKLTQKEFLKSFRDVILSMTAMLVPQILELVQAIDFGKYSLVASMLLGAILPFVNRYTNILRVK